MQSTSKQIEIDIGIEGKRHRPKSMTAESAPGKNCIGDRFARTQGSCTTPGEPMKGTPGQKVASAKALPGLRVRSGPLCGPMEGFPGQKSRRRLFCPDSEPLQDPWRAH